MKEQYRSLFHDIIASSEEEKLTNARTYLLEINDYLTRGGVNPFEKKKFFESLVYAPLLIDGPINEDECKFISAALAMSLSTPERIASRLSLMNMDDVNNRIFYLTKMLPSEAMEALTKFVFIALVIDGDGEINDIEERFLEKLTFSSL